MADTGSTIAEHPQPGLFKADHPRKIDRHIAFFGEQEAAACDMCGETLLDALTHGTSEAGEAI